MIKKGRPLLAALAHSPCVSSPGQGDIRKPTSTVRQTHASLAWQLPRALGLSLERKSFRLVAVGKRWPPLGIGSEPGDTWSLRPGTLFPWLGTKSQPAGTWWL